MAITVSLGDVEAPFTLHFAGEPPLPFAKTHLTLAARESVSCAGCNAPSASVVEVIVCCGPLCLHPTDAKITDARIKMPSNTWTLIPLCTLPAFFNVELRANVQNQVNGLIHTGIDECNVPTRARTIKMGTTV